jgi:hypothetical protein
VTALLLDPAKADALSAGALEFARGYHLRMVRALADVVHSSWERGP